MMKSLLKVILVVVAMISLASCGSKLRTYTGPEVTTIEVHKADRKMYLLHGTEVLKTYKIRLGGNPIGHKQFEGDQKTPEGAYRITHRNPRSSFHLSLGISYPNDTDRAFAKANGKEPGGDIFIHGQPTDKRRARGDWTVGCIAVTNREMDEIYVMVNPGTQINIFP